jgi:hypothetical protein
MSCDRNLEVKEKTVRPNTWMRDTHTKRPWHWLKKHSRRWHDQDRTFNQQQRRIQWMILI